MKKFAVLVVAVALFTAVPTMAAGKTVVASDAFGLREIVGHEKTGIIFTSGDTDALTKALRMLILNSGLRKTYGAEGLLKALRYFDIFNMQSKLNVLYNK
jgi:glycosyltransferase involved in cell wall biosynthesis